MATTYRYALDDGRFFRRGAAGTVIGPLCDLIRRPDDLAAWRDLTRAVWEAVEPEDRAQHRDIARALLDQALALTHHLSTDEAVERLHRGVP